MKQTSFCVGGDDRTELSPKMISCHCIQNVELLSDESFSNKTTDGNWIIPITILNGRSSDSLSKHVFKEKEERIRINFDANRNNNESFSSNNEPVRKKRRSLSLTSNWLKLNVCAGAPYRVLYSSNLIEQLIAAIVRHELNTFDRFNLENDMYALAMGGFTSLVDYLRLLSDAFTNETDDELVWKDIESNIIRIATLFEYDPELYEFYRKFIIDFHQNLFQRIGLTATNNESVARTRLRCYVLVILGTIGNDSRVINYAREQINLYLNDSSISVLWPICAIIAHHASDNDLNNLIQLWQQRLRRDDRLRCAYGLSYVQNAKHIEQVFELFSNHSSNNSNHSHTLRLHERIECYKGFCLSKQGRHAFQRYVENNWLTFRMNYTDEYLEALVRETFGYFSTYDEARRIEEFFNSYENFNQKLKTNPKENPSTPCTRIAVHLSLDDTELSSLPRSNVLSPTSQTTPTTNQRSVVPVKVKELASIIAHTTRARAALFERDRDNVFKYFQSKTFTKSSHDVNASSQTVSVNNCSISNSRVTSPTKQQTCGNKRKRRLSSLTASTNNTTTNSSSSPPVRNLLASDAAV